MKTSVIIFINSFILTFTLNVILSLNCYSQSDKYVEYYNNRFGFSFLYPNTFNTAEAPTNGDGQEFTSQDGQFYLISFGGNDNSFDYKSIKERYSEDLLLYDEITYKKLFSDYYVLSGINKGEIFYIKKYVGEACINIIEMRYPIINKNDFNDIVTTISKSFKSGNLNESQ